jgi:hypothetical protein
MMIKNPLNLKLFLNNQFKIKCLNRFETLAYAIKHNYSISRFGDGEISLSFHSGKKNFEGIIFQKADELLAEKLRYILFKPIDNLLVCYNNSWMKSSTYPIILDYERSAKNYIKYLSINRPRDIGVLSRKKNQLFYLYYFFIIVANTYLKLFGDATCFSLSYFYEHYQNNRINDILELYQKFFAQRRILFVSPDEPLMGESFRSLVDNGIIKSPSQIHFIAVPKENCFEYYDNILEAIQKFNDIDTVFLQCGPTATILAADLTQNYGMTAYDVGSFNISLQKAALMHNISF